MAMKLLMLVIFFAIMVSVGIYARKHATSVDGYVLGGRSVGPWLTAFAYGTSYFSAVVFATDELVLEPQPARQPIAKAAQVMADNIFLILFFIHFLLVRNF